MNPDELAQYLEIFLAFAGVIAALAAFVRWGNKGLEAKISEQIKEATKQIQPDANGGLSLADVAKGVRELRTHQIVIDQRLCDIDEKFTARMDASDATRSVILSQVAMDRAAWVDVMREQGIDVPAKAVKYTEGEQ